MDFKRTLRGYRRFGFATIAALSSAIVGLSGAAAAPNDWAGQPLPTTLTNGAGATFDQGYEQGKTEPATPACFNPTNGALDTSGGCSPAQTAAGDLTEAVALAPATNFVNALPAAASAAGSLAAVNVQGEYPDSSSPTGVSYIDANIPLNAFATASSVSNETSRATGAEAALGTSVASETSRAQTSETGLAASVTTETTRATSAESNLATGVAQETARATSAETAITTGVTQETTRAESAETNLATGISQETARATSAETVIATNITHETTRAESAETNLATGISQETTRATSAETVITTDISQETTRAESAEASLATGVGQETARAQSVEAVLGAAIGAETAARKADVARVTQGYRASTAAALALGGAVFLPGKRFNLTVNTGTYEGEWALAAQAGFTINDHLAFSAGVTHASAGAGTGGRAGFTVGW